LLKTPQFLGRTKAFLEMQPVLDVDIIRKIGGELARTTTPYRGQIVVVGQIPFLVLITPYRDGYPSCAKAEAYLGVTLDWAEHPDCYRGYVNGIHLATVLKPQPSPGGQPYPETPKTAHSHGDATLSQVGGR
jgi:hypothetical protein